MPLALACADAGHDVTVATGAPFVGQLPLPTIQSVPPDADIDGLVAETRRRHQEATGDDLVVGMFADMSAEAISDILLRQLKDGRPDLVGLRGDERRGRRRRKRSWHPALAFAISITHGGYSSIHPATVGFRQRVWAERGLKPPLGAPLLAEALLDPAPPSLQSLSGPYDVPKIPIRSQAWTGGTAPVSDWLRAPKTRPRIYLTLGTVSFGAVEVLRRVIDDLTNLNLDLLVAVGPEGDPAAVGEVSAHVHLERFVDQAQVLRFGRRRRPPRRHRHGPRSVRGRRTPVDLASGRRSVLQRGCPFSDRGSPGDPQQGSGPRNDPKRGRGAARRRTGATDDPAAPGRDRRHAGPRGRRRECDQVRGRGCSTALTAKVRAIIASTRRTSARDEATTPAAHDGSRGHS